MGGKSSLEEEKQTTDISHGRGVVMPEPSYKQEKKKYKRIKEDAIDISQYYTEREIELMEASI